jgi:hypothetical protein
MRRRLTFAEAAGYEPATPYEKFAKACGQQLTPAEAIAYRGRLANRPPTQWVEVKRDPNAPRTFAGALRRGLIARARRDAPAPIRAARGVPRTRERRDAACRSSARSGDSGSDDGPSSAALAAARRVALSWLAGGSYALDRWVPE